MMSSPHVFGTSHSHHWQTGELKSGHMENRRGVIAVSGTRLHRSHFYLFWPSSRARPRHSVALVLFTRKLFFFFFFASSGRGGVCSPFLCIVQCVRSFWGRICQWSYNTLAMTLDGP